MSTVKAPTLNRFLRHLQQAGFLLPAGLTGVLWLKGLHPGLPGLSCPLRALTGIPCPTCYLTRATSAALTGNLGESIQWHAFGPVVATALLVWSAWAIQQRRLWPIVRLARWPLALGGGSLLVYWVLRLSLNSWPNL
ncbi:MAG: DUF2752 domain-containing protein [Synechococcus sp.]